MIRERSAGAIVFYKEGSKIYYLLLRYPTNLEGREKEYWGFAKGRFEKGEKIEQTAKREIREETGLKNIRFIKGFKEEEKYFFTRKKERISKRVTYLLAEAKTKKIKISDEHLDYKWLSFQPALKRLTFKNAKDLLVKANHFLLKKEPAKAILLFSGGLDSILTAKILQRQKIKLMPVCFESYFFGCQTAEKSAKSLGLKLKIIDFSKEHLKIVKNPKYGQGKGINPCFDCHLLMIKKAKKIMEKEKADFLASGEVLGQRPFSQNRKALFEMEKKANLKGLILRPLSAKFLPLTLLEKREIIDRDKLFAISGKSRKKQFKIAKEFGIKKFPSPAGGCILTDLAYSKKLKAIFEKISQADGKDCQLLKRGRVFWQDNFLILLGRNEKENQEIKELKKKNDIILEPESFSGPSVLIRGFGRKIKDKTIIKATEFLLNYSKNLPEEIRILVRTI